MPRRRTGLTYAQAGVDVEAGNSLIRTIRPIVKATARPGADAVIGGFGGIFDVSAAGFKDPLLVAATDGVGTKVKVAVETGRHATIGIDLVAMCVNDLVVQAAEPLFFLDYFASGKLEATLAAEVIGGIAEGCRLAGCALIGGETAEMPGLYEAGDYDLAGFAVGAVERERLLPRADLGPGDELLALASSGVHSNGFSLVRRVVAESGLDWRSPAPFEAGRTLGEALLEPTRIYVRSLLRVIRETGAIKALAHITGGGLVDNIPRVLPHGLAAEVEVASLPFHPVFQWIASSGGISSAEMLRTFNCGAGMVAVVGENAADQVLEALRNEGEVVVRIGHLVQRQHEQVRFSGTLPL